MEIWQKRLRAEGQDGGTPKSKSTQPNPREDGTPCTNTVIMPQVRFVGTWKTSEAENEKRRQMAAAAQRAAAQKTQVAEAAELKRKNDANLRKDMQTQVSATLITFDFISREKPKWSHFLWLPHSSGSAI